MRTIPLLSIALVASLATACTAHTKGTDPTEPTNGDEDASSIQSALEDDNGALTTVDEAPEFADPQVASLPGFDPASAEVSDAPGADDVANKSYRVAIIWGHLPTPADATSADPDPVVIDWTGSVSVDAGAIGVSKTIKFDARDHLERRTDKQEVSFVSHTLPFVDGLLLHVVVPAAGAQTLHFKTAAATFDIDLTALAKDGFEAHRLGDGRNGVALAGYADVKGCARGFIGGRWVKTKPALGRFRGRVIDGDGELLGHVRGIWGHAPKRDKNVFFGKYISATGTTRGLFGGTYGDGEFQGLWGTRNPADVGALQGVYSDGYEKDDGRGVWLGRWSEKCAP